MSGVVKSDLHFRIGHVLFIDIVGYSNLLITKQHDHVEQLNRLVRASHCFRTLEATGELLCLPRAMGGAGLFWHRRGRYLSPRDARLAHPEDESRRNGIPRRTMVRGSGRHGL